MRHSIFSRKNSMSKLTGSGAIFDQSSGVVRLMSEGVLSPDSENSNVATFPGQDLIRVF